jgi:hypothetical protein
VFDAAGDDQELALLQPDLPIPKLHPKPAFDDEEKFVLVVVVVPDERPRELHQLDLLTVKFANDLRFPLLAEQPQFLGKVDLFHDSSELRACRTCKSSGNLLNIQYSPTDLVVRRL